MIRRMTFIRAVVAIVGACICAITTHSAQAATTKHAQLGVYKGAGCDGVEGLEKFSSWFGREPDQVLEFFSWQVLSAGTTWGIGCWKKAGKTVVYSVPMLPADGSATLADGAAGKFDAVFRNYAAKLVKFGFEDSIIRIGWEFNGDWYPWAAAKDPKSYIAYWRRIASVMESVPGAKFRFDWCMAGGWTEFLPEQAYPGDDVVDIIGMDFYNMTLDPNQATPEARWESRMNTRRGLKWHRDFAAERNKPMSYPEWGTGDTADGRGGGDDAYFVEQMAAWIASNNVVYHNYWDSTSGVNATLSTGKRPKAAAAYKRVFKEHKPRPPTLDKPIT